MTGSGRRRICFVLPSLDGGGAERAAVQILNALDSRAWDRALYLFERRGPYLADVDQSVRVSSGDAGASRATRWSAFRRYVRDTRPDLVVCFLTFVSALSAARAARTGARVVFNQQTPVSAFLADADYAWRRPWRRRVFSLVTRIGYGLADAIVATSAGVADDLVATFGVRRDRIRVVHNPVDLDAVRAAAAEPLDCAAAERWSRPSLVAAGRLAEAKNYPLLIDAMALLRRAVPARLFILGAGDLEPQLRDRIAQLGLADAIALCGFQRNPWKYIARADVFVLTSRYEGFGNVLVEAMACGVPVVATTSPGTREIVSSGDDGLLVDEHDARSVAAALQRVLTDDGLRRRLAEGASRTAQRFALPTIAAAYDRAFAAVLV
jgi:glycosyltransferase involved in cell wall biosynthesis